MAVPGSKYARPISPLSCPDEADGPTSGRRVALVTGSSRGIGAETARQLGSQGVYVIVTYREKSRRADQVVDDIEQLGGKAVALGADLTDAAAVRSLVTAIRSTLGRLDIVVLNASGGMEADVDDGYAMRLNRDAQLMLLEECHPVMTPAARVVFVTSHQAHFVRQRPVPPAYAPVAASKRAGEDAVRNWAQADTDRAVQLAVVSGDMIEGTITVKLLERIEPGTVHARLQHAGSIPTITDFAAKITAAAIGPLPEDTIYVGGADYLAKGI